MRTLRINLDAIVHNLDVMRARANGAKVMGVVKANAYGHGAIPVAETLERAGVDYLGVADIREALELRAAGIRTPILAWLHDPDDNFEEEPDDDEEPDEDEVEEEPDQIYAAPVPPPQVAPAPTPSFLPSAESVSDATESP